MGGFDTLQLSIGALVELRKVVNKEYYPIYHIAPYAGWMNCPTGMIFFRDLYHVFYQLHPFDSNWGSMHWGHATSEDMISWRHHPIVLAPGDDWDRDGCFAGCSVVHDEKLYVFYTGHHWLGEKMDESQIYQVQCLAVSEDGFTFEKRGIVVKPPAGYMHFRDPMVWFQSGRWYMVCGASDPKSRGQLLLYSTDDLEDWDDSTFTVLATTDDKNVHMWENPNFFPMGERFVLIFSPQGLQPDGYKLRNHDHAGYLIGRWKPGKLFSSLNSFKELDLGHDFHAPQSFLAKDGRRIVIAWLGMWESIMPTQAHNWSGCLTIPRELVMNPHTGKLHMKPIRELEGFRRNPITLEARLLKENTGLLLLDNCSSNEVSICWNLHRSSAEKYGLSLGRGLEIFVDSQTNRLILDRHYPEFTISGYRSCPLSDSFILKLRVFFDRSSVEVFVNDGEWTLTSRIYPQEGDRVLRAFSVNGDAEMIGCDLWSFPSAIVQ